MSSVRELKVLIIARLLMSAVINPEVIHVSRENATLVYMKPKVVLCVFKQVCFSDFHVR